MATKCDEHIDSYDNLEFELPTYFDTANQLVARPKEHYRWIRERIVWGWDYSKRAGIIPRTLGMDSLLVWSLPIPQAIAEWCGVNRGEE